PKKAHRLPLLPQEGDGRTRQPGMKKKDKNREAARKSRKKQTERADQLHQDLESLEGTNSALRKEIASLEREALLYTAALERHKPFCCLKGPALTTLHFSLLKCSTLFGHLRQTLFGSSKFSFP
uniref:Basic leucine zipper ATF-like transcription factor 2 n=1 Tax=Takifugu rubripes TaxID=31033 RepID=A0A3B5JZH3_TAKRU